MREGNSDFVDFRILVWRQGKAVLPWEEASAVLEVGAVPFERVQQFAENDPNRPDVDFFAVVFLHEDELGRPVEPRCDVARQLSIQLLSGLLRLDQHLRDLRSL
jgi:hypothetical protein